MNRHIAGLLATIENRYQEIICSFLRKYGNTGNILKKIDDRLMMLDLDDEGISRELYFKGNHEANSTKFFVKEIKKGMKILEVGANIGYYALIAANIIGESGKVYAFEPSPSNFNLLRTNVFLNEMEDRFELFPLGVGAKDEELIFFINNKGNTSSFINRSDSVIKTIQELKVKVVSIDNFFNENFNIDYFRMDVEGYELEIINGMKKFLQSNNSPKGCFIEVHSQLLHKLGSSGKDFNVRMNGHGYTIKRASFRGREDLSVDCDRDFLKNPYREKGYWEIFYKKA